VDASWHTPLSEDLRSPNTKHARRNKLRGWRGVVLKGKRRTQRDGNVLISLFNKEHIEMEIERYGISVKINSNRSVKQGGGGEKREKRKNVGEGLLDRSTQIVPIKGTYYQGREKKKGERKERIFIAKREKKKEREVFRKETREG